MEIVLKVYICFIWFLKGRIIVQISLKAAFELVSKPRIVVF